MVWFRVCVQRDSSASWEPAAELRLYHLVVPTLRVFTLLPLSQKLVTGLIFIWSNSGRCELTSLQAGCRSERSTVCCIINHHVHTVQRNKVALCPKVLRPKVPGLIPHLVLTPHLNDHSLQTGHTPACIINHHGHTVRQLTLMTTLRTRMING